MDRDAFAARHVTNDLLTMKRITTTRARHHQIVNAPHDDRIITQPNQPLNCSHAAAQARLFLLVELLKLLLAQDTSR